MEPNALDLLDAVIAAAADGNLNELQALVLGDAFQHDLREMVEAVS